MEPFELKLHQVTFEENDTNLGQGEGQAHHHLDSFSALVHYDANFQEDEGSGNTQPLDGANLHDLTFAKLGK